jgi:ABC-type xylose transport system substrate-binding protein
LAKDITVGVSWSNFQEERWKTDEAAIKSVLDKAGAKYISADAQASPSMLGRVVSTPDRRASLCFDFLG